MPKLHMPLEVIRCELTRRRILAGGAAMAISSLLPGCTGGSSPGTAATSNKNNPAGTNTNPQPAPSGVIQVSTMNVTATSAGTIPSSAFVGLAYEKQNLYGTLFSASNSALIGLFKQLGPSVLRIGGDSVDKNVWTPSGAGGTPGQIAPPDVTAFAAFVKATGWQCIYGINLGGSSTGATNPGLAAEEAAFATSALGPSLLGFEIGNEPDEWGNPGSYYAGNWSLGQFETLWNTYRSAIVAMTPSANIVAPAASANTGTWTVPFAQAETKTKVNLVTQHYYRGDGTLPTSTAQLLLSPDTTLNGNVLPSLQSNVPGLGLTYRIGECNSFYNGGAPGVSNSYAASLWAIDFLFNLAQFGAAGANFQGGGTSSYTPISDNGVTPTSVNPVFYGMTLMTLAGTGVLYQTAVYTGSQTLNVTGYAVKTAAGMSLVINNKDATNNLQVVMNLPQTVNTASLIEMTQISSGAAGASLTATSGVTIQGGSISLSGALPMNSPYTLAAGSSQITCYVPKLSVVLIQIT